MLKQLIVILLFGSITMFSNVFQLSTIVDEQQLIPVIKVNGHIVIKVKDVGTKQVFSSSFERSEKIYQSLRQIGTQKSNLNRIRIRRNKADYVAYVDNIEVYRVTPSDVIGSELTVYQMASLWRQNIVDALKKKNITPSDSDINGSDPLSDASLPLISFLSIFSNNSIFIMMIQFLGFVLIQVIAIGLTFQYLNHRYKQSNDALHKRLKTFQNNQVRNKNLLSSLEQRINDLTDALHEKNNNISNING